MRFPLTRRPCAAQLAGLVSVWSGTNYCTLLFLAPPVPTPNHRQLNGNNGWHLTDLPRNQQHKEQSAAIHHHDHNANKARKRQKIIRTQSVCVYERLKRTIHSFFCLLAFSPF